MNYNEKQFIKDRFLFIKGNEFFYDSITSKKPFFVLNLNPKNKFSRKYYNTMLLLQNETLINMPESLKEILAQFDWKFKRLDIAFDSKFDYQKHVFLKNHGNVKSISRINWRGYYLGSNYSDSKLAVYDRNKKEEARKTGVKHDYQTRFECRIRPKLNDTNNIHKIDDNMILKQLSKYQIVEDATTVKTNKWNINRLYNLKDKLFNKTDYKVRWTRYGRKIQSELKEIVYNNKIPFGELFLKNRDNLFQWIPTRVIDMPIKHIG